MIDLSSVEIQPSDHEEFKELCYNICRFIIDEECVNRFKLTNAFPTDTYPDFEYALGILLEDGVLLNGSKGYIIGRPLEFMESEQEDDSCRFEDVTENLSEVPIIEGRRQLERIEFIREMDSRASVLLSEKIGYSPANVVEKKIEAMNRSTKKTILEKYFINYVDLADILRENKRDAERYIFEFSNDFPMDPVDEDIFSKYDVPSNVFLYIFNRSEAYYRLFQVNFNPGYGDTSEYIFPKVTTDKSTVNLTPNSDDELNARERAMSYFETYFSYFGNGAKSFTSALLAVFNDVSIKRTRVKEIYEQYFINHQGEISNESDWDDIFDDYIETEDKVKHPSYQNIQDVCNFIQSLKEIDYGISVEKLYCSNKDSWSSFFINSFQELEDFITKYTSYRIFEGRILVKGTLNEALQNYIRDVHVYDCNRLVKMYGRTCGGPAKIIRPFFEAIDMDQFVNEAPLTEEEEQNISVRLDKYQWLTKDNARSVFADLHNLEHKFNGINMHKLGFTSMQHVYYRLKYSSFSECLLQNEFFGDEIYVDDREFKLKMECSTFLMEVEAFERYLRWIPVSKYRYINLESSRYRKFGEILAKYRDIIIELCKQKFVTPFSLKNQIVGIPEIDEDYYDLEFYDAMLIASKANHQALARQRFYFIPTDSTSFGPTAPEFIRYIVYNKNGFASIEDIQAILENEYGIHAGMSTIRQQVKSSTCLFSTITDAAYLDDETYREVLNNESN